MRPRNATQHRPKQRQTNAKSTPTPTPTQQNSPPPLPLDPLEQLAAGTELEHEVRARAVVKVAEEGEDIGVVEPALDLDLPAQLQQAHSAVFEHL